jgi:regulator of protease activity HflC (stomatin/prohibitin superfamily)
MKNKNLLYLIAICLVTFSSSCRQKIPQGYVGIKVYQLGSSKGVDNEVLGVGKYFIGMNEDLFLFPVFQVNYVYTKSATEGSSENEEFTFQTKEGMECSVDLGVSIQFDQSKIAKMFQTYRKGVEDIRAVVVRNEIRDALNKISSYMPVESVYGEGKTMLVDSVQSKVKSSLNANGIIINKIYLIGSIRIPQPVKEALDSKVKMTQEAQRTENEVAKAKAEADIATAKARGRGDSILIVAESQAKANEMLSKSITPILVSYKGVEKWNGALSQYSGGSSPIPFINVK